MDTKHLSKEKIRRCAEAAAIDSSVNISNEIRIHLSECESCNEKIHQIAETIREDYKSELVQSLNIRGTKDMHSGKWLGFSFILLLLSLFAFASISNIDVKESYFSVREKYDVSETTIPVNGDCPDRMKAAREQLSFVVTTDEVMFNTINDKLIIKVFGK